MSWKRGLFRLWIVGTVLWLVFAGCVTDLGRQVSNYISLEKVPIADTPNDLEKVCPKLPDGKPGYDCMFDPTATRTSVIAKEQRENFVSVVKGFLVLGTAVPAGVLALGAALYWVFAGFTGNTRHSRNNRLR